MMPGMVIDMEEARLQTIAQVRAFLDGATEIAFRVAKAERYPFIDRVLTRCGSASQGRIGKGVLLRYLARITGLSRQQVPRLVRRYRQEGTLSTRHGPPQHGFRRRFTATDVALLADMDALHSTVSG
ncbi:MAG: helix-turn-helix domain-containing protein, partial [Nitrospira sp.]|nr:helix-turn-helix domain-containing protein [Nitrospira sp.]